MCGRFTLTHPNDAVARLFEAAPANDLPEGPRFNICPTQPVAVVIAVGAQRRFGSMRWGFVPHWYKGLTDGPLLINARAETLAEKPAFRAAARARRCLIPASGFYEWTQDSGGQRLPWFIEPRAGGVLAFGGLWQMWEGPEGAKLATCAIVTCGASAEVAHIHHRMPLVLGAADWPLWLGEAGHGAARLMVTAPEGTLAAHRVDPRVNSNRAEGAGLIEPLG